MKRHIRSSPSTGSSLATLSTMARRCISRSSTKVRRFRQSTNERDLAIVASRLRISRATAAGLSSLASSSRRRRLAVVLPVLISINSSASRWAPSASRFFAFSVFFEDLS